MSEEPKGAIPRIILFIVVLVIGILFAVPSEVDIGVMIIQGVARALQPFNNAQVSQMALSYIIYLRIFGWAIIIADIIGIYLSLKKGEYF